MPTNEQIIKAAGITTGDVTYGLLNSEQARTFIKQTFEATPLSPLVRHEMRRAKTGEIDKIGIASRILRKKVENVDANADGSVPTIDPATGQITGYRAKPNYSQVPYATTAVRLPWEISEETLRENIEGEGLEATITNLMTTQLGIDMEDLYLNGDESMGNAAAFSTTTAYNAGDTCIYDGKVYAFTAAHAAGAWTGTDAVEVADASDINFLYINDGWIKQISNGGHVYDASGDTSMSLDMFYGGLQAIPNKYNNGKLRWLMSPHRAQQWELFLLNQGLNAGANFPDSLYKSPASIPTVSVPRMPDDKIILADPQNLIVVNTYDVKIRKTTEGKEAIMADKRFYVVHLDFDAIIEELDATAIITGIA
uniref:Major capsid protein n=1 Tax=Dulem virus 37 TaxID=3145755 RepID=A0AAU8AYB4_9CAUD